jgi:hypothetical protein
MPPKRPRPLAPSDDSSSKRSRAASSDTSHAEKPYPCDQCDLSYVNGSSLGRHKREGHKREKHGTPTKFGCMRCGSNFLRPEGVKNHIDKNRCSSLRGDVTQPQQLLQTGGSVPVSCIKDPFASFLESDAWSPYRNSLPTAPQDDFSTHDMDPSLLTTASHDTGLLKPFHPVDRPERAKRLEHATSSLSSLASGGLEVSDWAWRYISCAGVLHNYMYDQIKLAERYETKKEKRFRDQRERREWKESRCTRPRPPCRIPLPPAFDLPPPQDLEYLLLLQRRARRRLYVMEAFHVTHRKFTLHALEHVDSGPTECRSGRIVRHTANVKQAWTDAVTTAHRLLSGKLPRELHSVLGVAQLASAICSAMNDIDSPIASEDKFLSDLSRWRQLLPSESHASFDCYANSLWDNRPPSDLAWEVHHDTETLLYFQDLLAEMLSHIEFMPPGEVDLASALPPLDLVSHSQDIPTHSSVSPIPIFHEASPAVMDDLDIPNEDDLKPSTLAEFTLFAVGAIFALIMAYILRKSPPPTLHKSALTTPSSIHRSLHRPGLVPLLHHNGPSITRPSRPASLAAACIPSYKLPASRTLDPAIGNGPHSRCRDAGPPTSPAHDARRPGLAAAHYALLRRLCRSRLRLV